MKTCIVIDDNEASLKLMQKHILSKPELELKAIFSNSIEGLKFLEKEMVDLVFVDIQMPDLNGLELIETIKSKRGLHLPHFILITGYSEYALQSYEYGVMDYLLKPVTFKRFDAAIDKFLNLVKPSAPAEVLASDFFFAEIDGVKTRINCSDVIYVEGAGNYISIFTTEKRILLHKTLNAISEMLNHKDFIRIHKSALIAINSITGMRGNEIFIDYQGKQLALPIGVTYKKSVMDRLNIL